ncbi:MAG: aminoacetone oxidase family FAD-binding enzyme [Eubacterium sp.]|nr:aminoacetone oxidase family FAD-binding enzyme [Eubacterium sp.]
MLNTVYDVCIIGAGASGLVAAIESSRRGLSSVVVDKNKKPGMKLYATGNGRCNLTNDTWEEDSYYGNEFVDQVYDAIYKKTNHRQRTFVTNYFDDLGLRTVSRDGYIYPASFQASSVVWTLLDAANYMGVGFFPKFLATSVDLINMSDFMDSFDMKDSKIPDDLEIYRINIENEEGEYSIYARNIILASGGLSQPKLGAVDSNIMDGLLESLKLPVRDFQSGLCPVMVNEDISELAGVRTRARLSIGKYSEVGELQLTEEGISGIVTFNLSYYMKPGLDIIINLLPKLAEEDMVEHFNRVKRQYPGKRLDAFLNGYVNDKLGSYMIRLFYGSDMKLVLRDVTETGIRGIYQQMTEWKLGIRAKAKFDNSQASIGGIITNVIDPSTMHISSDKCLGKRLFATGEVTDVIGKCGGYNLTYAFVTGYLAGTSVR